MDELDAVLRGLDEARDFARTYRFEMTDEYRALIARIEARPDNQTGRDKSSVWPALRQYVELFSRVGRPRHPL